MCNGIIPLLLVTVSGQERLDLLELSMLLTVQFGVDQPALAAALRPLVTQLAQDPTISAPERSEVSITPPPPLIVWSNTIISLYSV